MTLIDLAAKSPEQLVDSALQVYARCGIYRDSRSLHEAAMEYRAELIRIVTEYRAIKAGEDAAMRTFNLIAEATEGDQFKK